MEDQGGQRQESCCAKEHQPECGLGKALDEPGRDGAHEGLRDNQKQNDLGGLIELPEGQALDKHQDGYEDSGYVLFYIMTCSDVQ